MKTNLTDDRRIVLLIMMSAICSTTQTISAAHPVVKVNTIGMKFVEIPHGEFMMGAEEDQSITLSHFPYHDPAWLGGELPRHRVRITNSFDMGQYEVTLGQFLTFCHDANYKIEIQRDGKPSWGFENGYLVESNRFLPWAPLAWKPEMDHPVVYVSWNDATAFCEWLSKKEGRQYRLPTEAEWEYACRGGSESRYHFGNDEDNLADFANAADQARKDDAEKNGKSIVIARFEDNKLTDKKIAFPYLDGRDGYAWTAPIGKFQPNAFGLYDMHGNVWEWCADFYDEDYYKASPKDDPQGPGAGSSHIVRGGGFDNTPADLRCAGRFFDDPAFRYYSYGFRIVRVRD